MPLAIDGGRVPPRWAERKGLRPASSLESHAAGKECVRIAFINNMPDAALEETEIQFLDLLDAAAGDVPVEPHRGQLRLQARTAVPGVGRAGAAGAASEVLIPHVGGD